MQSTAVRGFKLSMQQARLSSIRGESPAYCTLCSVNVEGKLDLTTFQQAFKQLVMRHTILRTQFRSVPGMDIPLQVISEQNVEINPLINLENIELAEQERQVKLYVKMTQEMPFDLEREPLLRCALYRFSASRHIFLLNLSAFCGDSVTIKYLLAELADLYVTCLEGKTFTNDDTLQYTDVSAWQDELLEEEDAQEQYLFWQRADLSLLNATLLPFEHSPHVKTLSEQRGRFIPRVIEAQGEGLSSSQLEALLLRTNTSLEAFILTCWLVVIWRLTGQDSMFMGVECQGRTHEDLASAPGLYSQVVPITAALSENLPFERVLLLVHSMLDEARRRQLYFRWPSSLDGTENKPDMNFFPISFAYEDWPAAIKAGKLSFSLEKNTSNLEPFAVKLRALHVGHQLRLQLYFDPRYMATASAQRLEQCLHTLWQGVLQQPEASIGMLPILSSQEEKSLRSGYATPAISIPFQTFSQAFEAQVERYPEQMAVISGSEVLTYSQLNARANHLAHILLRSGVGPNVLVGLYMERSIASIVAMLAVFKAGGAYVPLDAEQPAARLNYQLHDLQAPLILTLVHLRDRFSSWSGQVLYLDDLASWGNHEAYNDPRQRSESEDLAYVIYTSGSTGVPKGVMIRQHSIMNYTFALGREIASQPGLHFATVSTLAADLGNTAIFCALTSGGCLHILDYATVTSGEAFADYLAQHPIDVLKIVPSHLSALLASCSERPVLPRKHLVLGGEALPYALLQRLEEQQCTCCVVNHYGPTETTIGALINVLGVPGRGTTGHKKESGAATAPIGRPIAGMEAFVLDQFQRIVPVGVTGELYLGGIGLAAGYLHLPEQTQARFVKHPWENTSKAQLYRTGDLARYREDGTIEFVGRNDAQVKLRGYRIELGEIEAALGQHPRIRENKVILREDTPGNKRLIAYMVGQQPLPDEQELRFFMEERLSGYMIPSAFVFLRALPLNTNGKVDLLQLPVPDTKEQQAKIYMRPQTAVEEILVGIWQSVLQAGQVGIHDNFFQLGGHSLLATQVISRVRTALQVDLSITSLFENPTIAGLATRLSQELYRVNGQGEPKGLRQEMPIIVPQPRNCPLPLSFAQQRLWFLHQLDPYGITYNIPIAVRLRGQLNHAVLRQALAMVLQRHENLRTTYPVQEEQPVQHIAPTPTTQLVVTDLSQLAQEKSERAARQLARQDATLPFDLAHGPLLRCQLLFLGEQNHILLLSMHHIISDGWSMSILVRELTGIYTDLEQGNTVALPALPVQYADYALWQRSWLQGKVLQQQLGYWKQQLADISVLELPTDYPRPEARTFPGATHFFVLPSSLSRRLKELGQQEGATLFMILLAAFNVLLHYYTDQDDIAVGTDVANRNRGETEELIGFFINQLVLRTNLSGNPSFREVLLRVREVALGAYVHQDLPFDHLLMELNPERDLSHTPLCQVKLVLQNTPPQEAILPDVRIETIELERNVAKFDMLLNMQEKGEELLGWLEYRKDLFSSKTIKRFLYLFEIVLEQAVSLSDIRLDEMESFLRETEVKKEEKHAIDIKRRNIQKMGLFKRKAK